MQQFHTEPHPCEAALIYSVPASGKPFYAAYCSCGWFGSPRHSKRRALHDARDHTTIVDPQVHGLEARGVPASLRSLRLDDSTGDVFLR